MASKLKQYRYLEKELKDLERRISRTKKQLADIESLGTVIKLNCAVFILCAQVSPVVPPHRSAVRCGIGLNVGITVIKIVPYK